ncbi:MAG: alpha/beta hydrolase family protein, partial [Blastocatellia bacterium]
PIAVLITGSGLQDRDYNPPGLNMFRFIAEKLSANGIAVLRHDDRGVGKSNAPNRPTSYRDLINDTRAAIEYVRSRKEIDPERVALIGHSEGAETAGILAEADPRIAAIALLSGASHPLDFVVIEQALYAEALHRPVDPAATNELPEVVRGLIQCFAGAKAGKSDRSVSDSYDWCGQHAAHDPLATIRMVKCPILILQGERDEDALAYNGVALAMAAAQAGNKHVLLRMFPNLTHVLVASPFDKSASFEQRSRVSEEVLDTLEKWAVATLVPGGGADPKGHSKPAR